MKKKELLDEYKMTVMGDVLSKSNSYKIITINGHSSLSKTKSLKEYEKSFYLQCPFRGVDIDGFFKIDIDVYYANNRKDLDGSFKILLDCLQQCKVIKNDRECVEIHARKMIDKINPRVVITINPVKGIEVHNTNRPTLFD